MYAIVDIAGQQFKVEKGKKVFVHRLAGDAGAVVNFDKVLLIGSQEKVNVGTPYISKAVVTAQILSHVRGDKVLIFKKKRRKGYQLQNGHRQDLTELLIEEISETGPAKKAEAKKETGLAREEAVAAETPSTAMAEEKKPAQTGEKQEKEGTKAVKQEASKVKKTATASKTATAKKPAAKPAAAASAEAKKKAAVKAGSGTTASKAKPAASKAKPAASKAKPAAKKTAEKKPVEKKK